MNLRKTTSASLNLKFFSKINPSFFTIKEGSTAFPKLLFLMEKVGCTRQYESKLSLRSFAQPFPSGYRGCANRPTRSFFFRKPTRPSLPLRKAPHLSPSLSLLRRERMCQPPYSVLKPLRYMVGGPSEVYASSGAADFCAGMDPLSLKDLIKGCLLVAFFENLPILP